MQSVFLFLLDWDQNKLSHADICLLNRFYSHFSPGITNLSKQSSTSPSLPRLRIWLFSYGYTKGITVDNIPLTRWWYELGHRDWCMALPKNHCKPGTKWKNGVTVNIYCDLTEQLNLNTSPACCTMATVVHKSAHEPKESDQHLTSEWRLLWPS